MKYFKLLIVVFVMSLIFVLSNEPASESSKRSNKVIDKTIIKIIHNDASNSEKKILYKKYTKLIRKSAHFCLYFFLGLSIFMFLEEYNISKIVLLSVSICMLYSISDEIHQLFVIGRSCELLDVLIDTNGSLFAILLKKVYNNYHSRRNYEKKEG